MNLLQIGWFPCLLKWEAAVKLRVPPVLGMLWLLFPLTTVIFLLSSVLLLAHPHIYVSQKLSTSSRDHPDSKDIKLPWSISHLSQHSEQTILCTRTLSYIMSENVLLNIGSVLKFRERQKTSVSLEETEAQMVCNSHRKYAIKHVPHWCFQFVYLKHTHTHTHTHSLDAEHRSGCMVGSGASHPPPPPHPPPVHTHTHTQTVNSQHMTQFYKTACAGQSHEAL